VVLPAHPSMIMLMRLPVGRNRLVRRVRRASFNPWVTSGVLTGIISPW
jgi:hypothetical protein